MAAQPRPLPETRPLARASFAAFRFEGTASPLYPFRHRRAGRRPRFCRRARATAFSLAIEASHQAQLLARRHVIDGGDYARRETALMPSFF